MTEHRHPLSRSEREAYRAVLEDALADLASGVDPDRSAREVMRALDSYLEATGSGSSMVPREPPVADFAERERDQLNWAKWLVVGGAVLATITVAIAFSGGWPVALAVVGIWALALFAMLNT